jgi:hypothetical protein
MGQELFIPFLPHLVDDVYNGWLQGGVAAPLTNEGVNGRYPFPG